MRALRSFAGVDHLHRHLRERRGELFADRRPNHGPSRSPRPGPGAGADPGPAVPDRAVLARHRPQRTGGGRFFDTSGAGPRRPEPERTIGSALLRPDSKDRRHPPCATTKRHRTSNSHGHENRRFCQPAILGRVAAPLRLLGFLVHPWVPPSWWRSGGSPGRLIHGGARPDSRSTAFVADRRPDRRSDGDHGHPSEGAA